MLVGFLLDGRHSGIDKYLLGFCDAAKEAGTRLDFLTQKIDPELKERLAFYGFGLIAVPSLKHPVKQYRAIKSVLRQGGYDGAYLNLSESFNCALLAAAKACGIPCRIAHSHSGGVDRMSAKSRAIRGFLHKLFRPYLSRIANRRPAWSYVAGKWMFTRDFEIVNNAVDGARFAYDGAAREKIRRELDLGDCPVFLHVGNFDYAKNQSFLLDVMKEDVVRGSGARLLLAGDGETAPSLKERAAAMGLADRVTFLGVRSDVPDLYSAADVFLFPSRIEGFGIACAEAQFSGLPCVVSDAVPREVQMSGKVRFLKTDDPARWAEAALASLGERRGADLPPESARYDAKNNRRQLLSILKGEAL